MLVSMVVCGAAIFVGLFVLGAPSSSSTSDASEVANAFTYGGNTMTQYPLTIYPTEVVKALTFLVPVAFVNWYPALYVLDVPDPFGLPGLAAVRLAGRRRSSCARWPPLAWRTGVRHYRSTGS